MAINPEFFFPLCLTCKITSVTLGFGQIDFNKKGQTLGS